ncbi:hypothetical protein [Noviherbaspirillum sedimenti]|uniref:hypothetical protein n=1 Tax=Noviherbaspirillum sedimenti TaxID=2320865 RepID=UPI0011C39EC6|nr:hypothetical protein [Noviherbaspirillum sedimenti]
MLIKCEFAGTERGVVSSSGPIDCAPAGYRPALGEWKYSLGGMSALAVALFLLVLLTVEAMHGGVLSALLASLGVA